MQCCGTPLSRTIAKEPLPQVFRTLTLPVIFQSATQLGLSNMCSWPAEPTWQALAEGCPWPASPLAGPVDSIASGWSERGRLLGGGDSRAKKLGPSEYDRAYHTQYCYCYGVLLATHCSSQAEELEPLHGSDGTPSWLSLSLLRAGWAGVELPASRLRALHRIKGIP
ncbi:hypothetical protein TgHK011_003582 [Trichoderma gracile]|nr:hypothetical protein TgHK011_003582 [Trichoderma gracile]